MNPQFSSTNPLPNLQCSVILEILLEPNSLPGLKESQIFLSSIAVVMFIGSCNTCNQSVSCVHMESCIHVLKIVICKYSYLDVVPFNHSIARNFNPYVMDILALHEVF